MFIPDTAKLGDPGDYYRSPLFSGGAWRVSAVQLGGLQNILRLHAERLVASGRADDPVVRVRFSGAAADYECARLLVEQAGRRAEDHALDPAAIDAYVDQARGQFERFALAASAAAHEVGLISIRNDETLQPEFAPRVRRLRPQRRHRHWLRSRRDLPQASRA